MKRKTLKNKSCYVVALMLSGILFLTGLTGCKDREAEFLMEGHQETESEKVSDDKKSDEKEGQKAEDSGADDREPDGSGANDPEKKNSSAADLDTEQQSETIYVDVCGAVANPGVFELTAGSRVFQAIEAAGGYLPEAVPNCVNRAGVLADGQQLYILTQEEMEQQGLSQAEMANAADGDSVGNVGAGGSAETVSSGQQDNKVNINTADEAGLTTLTGIGATRAQAIIAYREENGPFAAIEEIMNVQGIKEGTFAKIKDEIVVG